MIAQVWAVDAVRWLRRRRRPDSEGGQSLAEFALLAPLFMLLVIGLIEFAFAFNASLNTNYASREGGLIAAEAGNASAADCLILNAIDGAISSPTDRGQTPRSPCSGPIPRVAASTRRRPIGAAAASHAHARTAQLSPSRTAPSAMATRQASDATSCRLWLPDPYTFSHDGRHDRRPGHLRVSLAHAARFADEQIGGTLTSSNLTFVSRNVFRIEPIL